MKNRASACSTLLPSTSVVLCICCQLLNWANNGLLFSSLLKKTLTSVVVAITA